MHYAHPLPYFLVCLLTRAYLDDKERRQTRNSGWTPKEKGKKKKTRQHHLVSTGALISIHRDRSQFNIKAHQQRADRVDESHLNAGSHNVHDTSCVRVQ